MGVIRVQLAAAFEDEVAAVFDLVDGKLIAKAGVLRLIVAAASIGAC